MTSTNTNKRILDISDNEDNYQRKRIKETTPTENTDLSQDNINISSNGGDTNNVEQLRIMSLRRQQSLKQFFVNQIRFFLKFFKKRRNSDLDDSTFQFNDHDESFDFGMPSSPFSQSQQSQSLSQPQTPYSISQSSPFFSRTPSYPFLRTQSQSQSHSQTLYSFSQSNSQSESRSSFFQTPSFSQSQTSSFSRTPVFSQSQSQPSQISSFSQTSQPSQTTSFSQAPSQIQTPPFSQAQSQPSQTSSFSQAPSQIQISQDNEYEDYSDNGFDYGGYSDDDWESVGKSEPPSTPPFEHPSTPLSAPPSPSIYNKNNKNNNESSAYPGSSFTSFASFTYPKIASTSTSATSETSTPEPVSVEIAVTPEPLDNEQVGDIMYESFVSDNGNEDGKTTNSNSKLNNLYSLTLEQRISTYKSIIKCIDKNGKPADDCWFKKPITCDIRVNSDTLEIKLNHPTIKHIKCSHLIWYFNTKQNKKLLGYPNNRNKVGTFDKDGYAYGFSLVFLCGNKKCLNHNHMHVESSQKVKRCSCLKNIFIPISPLSPKKINCPHSPQCIGKNIKLNVSFAQKSLSESEDEEDISEE